MTRSGRVPLVVMDDAFIDDDDSNATKKGTIADLVTAIAGDALVNNANQLEVAVDNSSIERNSDALRVKALGVTDAMLAGSISNAKLSNSSITVTAGDGLKTGGLVALGDTVTLDIDVGDFAGTGLEESGSDLRISAAAAGGGLTGGGGSALSVNPGNGILIDSNQVKTDDSKVAHLTGSVFTGQIQFNAALTGSTDIVVGANIIHDTDPDTLIAFTPDGIRMDAGGITAVNLVEDGVNSTFTINENGNEHPDGNNMV